MDRDQVAKDVRDQVTAALGPDASFTDTDLLPDHGLDSLRSVELTLTLEDRFGIVFEDEELAFENFVTVSGIVDLVHRKLGDG
ncbi:acyl carrier protein [Streptomyces sp. NPDC002588]|uniref:acyl carrier protein n=1 Tax=Streptomyces sp. NPDC002588 TaxID=3154419 RepID=UPI003329E5CF